MTTRDPESSSSCANCDSLHANLLALVTQWRKLQAEDTALSQRFARAKELSSAQRHEWMAGIFHKCADDLAALLGKK